MTKNRTTLVQDLPILRHVQVNIFHPMLVLCPFNQTKNLSDLGIEYQMNAVPDRCSFLDTKDEKNPAKDKSKKREEFVVS